MDNVATPLLQQWSTVFHCPKYLVTDNIYRWTALRSIAVISNVQRLCRGYCRSNITSTVQNVSPSYFVYPTMLITQSPKYQNIWLSTTDIDEVVNCGRQWPLASTLYHNNFIRHICRKRGASRSMFVPGTHVVEKRLYFHRVYTSTKTSEYCTWCNIIIPTGGDIYRLNPPFVRLLL